MKIGKKKRNELGSCNKRYANSSIAGFNASIIISLQLCAVIRREN